MTSKEDARYFSDKATLEIPNFRSACNDNFGYKADKKTRWEDGLIFPEELPQDALIFLNVKQENYKRWLKEEDIKTIKESVKEINFMVANLQYQLLPESGDYSEHLALAKRLVSEINPPELIVEVKYPRRQPRMAIA